MSKFSLKHCPTFGHTCTRQIAEKNTTDFKSCNYAEVATISKLPKTQAMERCMHKSLNVLLHSHHLLLGVDDHTCASGCPPCKFQRSDRWDGSLRRWCWPSCSGSSGMIALWHFRNSQSDMGWSGPDLEEAPDIPESEKFSVQSAIYTFTPFIKKSWLTIHEFRSKAVTRRKLTRHLDRISLQNLTEWYKVPLPITSNNWTFCRLLII